MRKPAALKAFVDKLYDLFYMLREKFGRPPLAKDADPFTFIVVDMSGGGTCTHMLRIDTEKII